LRDRGEPRPAAGRGATVVRSGGEGNVTELSTLADLAEVFGAFVVLGGLGFAVVQMLHYRQQRRETAAFELLRSFQNPEFSRSLRAVLALPRGVCKSDLGGRGSLEQDAIMVVVLTFECIGVMVFRGIVPLEMVDELLGGVCVESWLRLSQFMRDSRAESERDTMSEWFQWLAERLQEHHERCGRPPAYERYRNWIS
jgi:hypothetical protein